MYYNAVNHSLHNWHLGRFKTFSTIKKFWNIFPCVHSFYNSKIVIVSLKDKLKHTKNIEFI